MYVCMYVYMYVNTGILCAHQTNHVQHQRVIIEKKILGPLVKAGNIRNNHT